MTAGHAVPPSCLSSPSPNHALNRPNSSALACKRREMQTSAVVLPMDKPLPNLQYALPRLLEVRPMCQNRSLETPEGAIPARRRVHGHTISNYVVGFRSHVTSIKLAPWVSRFKLNCGFWKARILLQSRITSGSTHDYVCISKCKPFRSYLERATGRRGLQSR
jgi:hypothetical protein